MKASQGPHDPEVREIEEDLRVFPVSIEEALEAVCTNRRVKMTSCLLSFIREERRVR